MTPIPRAAAPVVWFIRWWVPKPKVLPEPVRPGNALGWPNGVCRCPLGLLPGAIVAAPMNAEAAGIDSEHHDAVREFWGWWDSQTDARAAVDAVWGKGPRGGSK